MGSGLEINKLVDKQSKVLAVAGLIEPKGKLSSVEIQKRYDENIVAGVIELKSGADAPKIKATDFDQRAATKDPARSEKAPENAAKVMRVPFHGVVYTVKKGDQVDAIILPISGYGLWSTMYGFLALDQDAQTIRGITFYEHGETPGLGGEVENPRWQALWKGRKAFNDAGKVAIAVTKGPVKGPSEDPYRVDSISGATITSRGVTATLAFWLGPNGYGPYLGRLRSKRQGGT